MEAQQGSFNPYKQMLAEYRDKALAQKALDEEANRKNRLAVKGTSSATTKIPRFDTDEALRAGLTAGATAVPSEPGQKLDYSQFTPEQAAAYNQAVSGTYARSAQNYNQRLRGQGVQDQSLYANENPGDYLTQGQSTETPGFFNIGGVGTTNTKPGVYAPTPNWGNALAKTVTKKAAASNGPDLSKY